MKITCQQNESKKNVFTVFVDDSEWKDIHKSIFGYNQKTIVENLKKGDLHSDFSAYEKKQVKRYLLRLLSKRNYSSFELQKMLKQRLVSSENASVTIEEIQSLGYIKDLEWIEIFIKTQINRKVGPKIIALKLKNKNVPQEFIEENLRKFVKQECKIDAIERLIKFRYQRRDLSDYHQKNKVIAAILRKGFDLVDVLLVLDGKF